MGERNILVVDDEENLANLYEIWLSENHNVKTANSGKEAIEEMNEDIDTVFLDRNMPGMTGEEVASKIREEYDDFKTVMVTAVSPDFDVLEMEFDAYLTKPIDREDFTELLSELDEREKYREEIQELLSLIEKRVILEDEKTDMELDDNPQYQELLVEIDEKMEKLDEQIEELMKNNDSRELYQMLLND